MISLCHFDIAQAIMSLSHFWHCPRQGHIDRLKHVCGYIHTFPHGTICFHTGIPDHEKRFGTSPVQYDWMESIYGNPQEEVPHDCLQPKVT